jgi:exonuclease III
VEPKQISASKYWVRKPDGNAYVKKVTSCSHKTLMKSGPMARSSQQQNIATKSQRDLVLANSVQLANRYSALSLDTNKSNAGSNKLVLGLWNAQSLRNKTQLTKEFIDEHDIDLYFVVETWLKDNEPVIVGELEDGDRFRLINHPRQGRPGGGLCCIHKSVHTVKQERTNFAKTMETMESSIIIKGVKITVVTIYRPPITAKNHYSMSEFFDNLTDIFSHYCTFTNEVLFIGDFNIHINKHNDTNTIKFLSCLSSSTCINISPNKLIEMETSWIL